MPRRQAASSPAAGDSKRPLFFLITGCITKIVPDVVLVVCLRMGAELPWPRIRLDGRMPAGIIQIGLPAGLQSVMHSL